MIVAVGAEAAEMMAAIHAEVFPRGWSASDFVALLGNSGAFALADDAVGGFVLGWAAAGEAEIVTLAVSPSARRQGIGAALVSAAVEISRSKGAHSLHLEVAEDNAPGIALYSKSGFEAVGMRPNYYSESGVNAVVMRRTLLG